MASFSSHGRHLDLDILTDRMRRADVENGCITKSGLKTLVFAGRRFPADSFWNTSKPTFHSGQPQPACIRPRMLCRLAACGRSWSFR